MDEATEAIFRSLNPKRDIGRIDEVVVNPGALCFESREETELKMGSNRSGLFGSGSLDSDASSVSTVSHVLPLTWFDLHTLPPADQPLSSGYTADFGDSLLASTERPETAFRKTLAHRSMSVFNTIASEGQTAMHEPQ